MVANVLGDVKTVLMAGHAITWISLLVLHRFALRDFIYSENLIEKSTLVSESEEDIVNVEQEPLDLDENNSDGESIGDDEEVDWSETNPEPIEADDNWGDDDDELEDDLELID